MSEENITELGRHEPSVESVISRLDRHQGEIAHITAIVEWNNGTCGVYHDSKSIPDMAYDLLLLQQYTQSHVIVKGDA
ncbi:MAG: hypothetical protein AB2669_19955 [Candidatus Thiodiazotropha endolucinida]